MIKEALLFKIFIKEIRRGWSSRSRLFGCLAWHFVGLYRLFDRAVTPESSNESPRRCNYSGGIVELQGIFNAPRPFIYSGRTGPTGS